MNDEYTQTLNNLVARVMGNIYEEKSNAHPETYFPGDNGFKYLYWKTGKGKRVWKFCYSTTRNGNGKFVSWIYAPAGKGTWKMRRFRELRNRNKSKARALQMYRTYERNVEKRKIASDSETEK